MAKELGQLSAKLALLLIKIMKYGIDQFLLHKFRLWIHIKHSSVIITLHELQTYTFVQFSDKA